MKTLLLIVLCCVVLSTQATTFTVNSTADNVDNSPGDGICQDIAGFCTLRAAIQESNALVGADTIYLQRSTVYPLSLNSGAHADLYGDLNIKDDLTLSIINPTIPATSVLELPIIDANGIDRVFSISSASEVTLMGLYITGGDASVNSSNISGGGIYVESNVSQFNLLNSVVSQNNAVSGGGLTSWAANSLISFSDISRNFLVAGSLNSDGAAILNRNGEMKIQYSTIYNNSKDSAIPGCAEAVLNQNSAQAMYVLSTDISYNGYLYAQTECVDGLYSQNGGLYIVNVTLNENSGYGLNFYDYPPANFELFMRNSLINNSGIQNCRSLGTGFVNLGDSNGGHNIDSGSSCGLPAVSGNLSNTNPMLKPARALFDGLYFLYHELMPHSPALDGGSALPVNIGNPHACQQFDQLLRTRPMDGNGDAVPVCDIGAVESDLIFGDGFE
jgi:CSLREA domain-containing protein